MNYLLWVDLETSGLDPHKCDIVEAAWAITPLKYEEDPVFLVQSMVLFADSHTLWEDGARKMHQASGLYDECRLCTSYVEGGVQTLRVLDSAMQKSLDAVTGEGTTVYLAGSSVHFDMAFLRVHLPNVAKRLHYRLFDVSAVKLFMESRGHEFNPRESKPHRAAADIRASFALYHLCANLRDLTPQVTSSS